MRNDTRLNKILKMEDSNLKIMKLFGFNMTNVLPHCELWEIAKKEFDRLWENGYRISLTK